MKVYRTDEVCDVIGEVDPDKMCKYKDEERRGEYLDGDVSG